MPLLLSECRSPRRDYYAVIWLISWLIQRMEFSVMESTIHTACTDSLVLIKCIILVSGSWILISTLWVYLHYQVSSIWCLQLLCEVIEVDAFQLMPKFLSSLKCHLPAVKLNVLPHAACVPPEIAIYWPVNHVQPHLQLIKTDDSVQILW